MGDPAFYGLSVCYALVILGSVVGNLLVITAVFRSPHMRKVNGREGRAFVVKRSDKVWTVDREENHFNYEIVRGGNFITRWNV